RCEARGPVLLRRRPVGEDAGLILPEDAVARERAEQSMERVRVRADLARNLVDGSWSVSEGFGDLEIADDREGPRAEGTAENVPELRLRSARPHQRAATTAAATSSTSASLSVRQSSSSRPSRTTPITGGSPWRSGPASSSSTAHAKLGSSASGSAPPPILATVSSTSPPTCSA